MKTEKITQKANGLVDTLIIFSSVFMTIFLFIVLIGSLKYFNLIQPMIFSNIYQLLFYLGNLIAIVTVLAQWIEGRYRSIMRILNKYHSKNK